MTKTLTFSENKIPAVVKVCQVAELLSLCHQTVYKLIDDGQLAAADVATTAKRRHLRVTRDSLLKFYKKRFGHSLERALANQANES